MTGRTIGGLGIGSERGNECCTCCGGCYSGCCPCKPQGDLTLTVTQWYVRYKSAKPGDTWQPIDAPCNVEVTLKKRNYECLGSGAREDDRKVYNNCIEDAASEPYLEDSRLTSIEFFQSMVMTHLTQLKILLLTTGRGWEITVPDQSP